MSPFTRHLVVLLLPALLLVPATAPQAATTYQECLLRAIAAEEDSLTLGEVKAACRAEQKADADRTSDEEISTDRHSLQEEQEEAAPSTHADHFSVTPHKQNYILLYSHNTAPNHTPYQGNERIDHDEVTFQVSLKFPVFSFQLGDTDTHLMAAYTARSFWQAYNKTLSSPFRETNHEPELFVVYPLDLEIPGLERITLMGGLVHQSNGRSEPLSRSWNRLYVDLVLAGDNFKVSLKPWYRIPEKHNNSLGIAEGDDNPDISDYLGYGEISGALKINSHTVSFLLRNNLKDHDNKGAVQLGWSFKIPFIKSENLKGYLHYFNGYGESLIDYDASVERIGIGLMLADWL